MNAKGLKQMARWNLRVQIASRKNCVQRDSLRRLAAGLSRHSLGEKTDGRGP